MKNSDDQVTATSLSSRRRIFPDGDFGIASMKSTRRIFLYGATRVGDERHELFGRRRRFQHDERAGNLAGLFVLQRDDGRIRHRRDA